MADKQDVQISFFLLVNTKQTELDHNGIITSTRQLVRHITQEPKDRSKDKCALNMGSSDLLLKILSNSA